MKIYENILILGVLDDAPKLSKRCGNLALPPAGDSHICRRIVDERIIFRQVGLRTPAIFQPLSIIWIIDEMTMMEVANVRTFGVKALHVFFINWGPFDVAPLPQINKPKRF